MRKKTPELLIPAGGLSALKTAVRYGADAVYIGGADFGLRAKAENFSEDEMAEGICFAHEHGKKVYVAANIFAHNEDISPIRAYFKRISRLKPDALIISDPGVYDIALNECPDIDRHISTQANNTNYASALFWHRLKAKRIVTARELSLSEIGQIRERIPKEMEIETFIHGSMCISYSGRCLLSNFMTGRDANAGECTHPCRWKYYLMEEERPGEFFSLNEDDRGTYIFNSKDLCMIEYIPELIDAGIDSFKVEGRMKNALYVATVARTYRKAIDDALYSREEYESKLPWYKEQIANCTYRGFTTGFFFGKPTSEDHIYDNSAYRREAVFLGIVNGTDRDGRAVLIQKNKFCEGDTIEIMKPDGRDIETVVDGIYDAEGKKQPSAPHAKQEIHVEFSVMPEEGDVLRAAVKTT